MSVQTKSSQAGNITSAAIAIALTVVFMLVFRGPASIISALVVPAVIVLLAKNKGLIYYILISCGLVFFALLLFQTQLVFVGGYLLLSLALKLILVGKNSQIKLKPLPISLYTASVIIVLFLCIRLTEWLFLIPLHQMMLRLSDGNPLLYLLILFAESILICAVNIAFLKVFYARMAFNYI